MQQLSQFPRVSLAHRPTPLERMPNLSRELERADLFVKRDDCTGLAMGGNKVRQLEFYLGEAIAEDATVVLITGAVQSNYVRCAAAAAAKTGLRCVIQLEDRVKGMGSEYHESGNVLLDHVLGAEVHTYPDGEDEAGADRSLDDLANTLRGEGQRPYVVHLAGDHPPLGALAYVEAAEEILTQMSEHGVDLGSVTVASGSAQTHAGLLVGFRAKERPDVAVHGVCVRRDASAQAERVLQCARATEKLLGCGRRVRDQDVLVTDKYLGPGYGRPTPEMQDAMLTAARLEGLLLDPVYTSKAFAHFLGLIRENALGDRSAAIFLHTGGTPALFAYGGHALAVNH